MKEIIFTLLFVPLLLFSQQKGQIEIIVQDHETGASLPFVQVRIEGTSSQGNTTEKGRFKSNKLPFGTHVIHVSFFGYEPLSDTLLLQQPKMVHSVKMQQNVHRLSEVEIKEEKKENELNYKLKFVEGVLISHGKKSEVIDIAAIDANKAANTGRQIYAKIAGLNIWESDGAGIQLGIGGRGLDPSRTSNFNTRQNGYDISADALGYPESYYTPTSEAVQKIQLIRGAASLQFGTQFGGLLNFVMKEGGKKKAEIVYRQTKGSYGFDNFFASVGGTNKSLNYYVYGNLKNGNDWRPNASFNVKSAGVNLRKNFNDKTSLKIEATKMNYLTQQPGGLTDFQFNSDPSVSVRERNWFRVDWNLLALTFDHKFKGNSKLNSRFFGLIASREALGFLGQINRVDPLEERTLISGKYENWGNETRWLKSYQVKSMDWSALVGFRVYKGYSEGRQGLASAGKEAEFEFLSDTTDGSSYVFPSMNYAVFAEHIFQFTKKIGITPGVRFEHINTTAKGEYRDVVSDLAGNVILDSLYTDNRQNARNILIGGLGLNYQWHKKHRVYANFSQNYRSINFTDMQIQNPNFKIDPDLQDEKGFNIDFGFQGSKGGKFYYDVSGFLLSYANRIGTTIEVDPVWYNTYQYRTNISASLTKGVESMIEFDLWKIFISDTSDFSLRVFSNASIVDAEYINSETSAFEGKKVELVPPFTFKSGVRFQYKKIILSYQYSYTAEHFSDATNSASQANAVNGIIPSYQVSDLSAKYTYKRFQFESGINNLTNTSYFTRRASGYPGPGIIPASPRTFYFTLQVKI